MNERENTMQQDEHDLVRLLTALPSEPDPEAAVAAIAECVAHGGGTERLPPDLFAGLPRRADASVLVLHPTARARRRQAAASRPRWWFAAVATLAGVGLGIAASWLAFVPREPTVPPVAEAEPIAMTSPLPARSEPLATDPQADAHEPVQTAIVIEALQDEDPTRPERRRKSPDRAARQARKIWRVGRLAFEDGDLDAARTAFTSCLAVDPDNSRCLNSMGRIAAAEGDAIRASTLFSGATAADPDNPFPMVNLATLAILDRRLDEADALLRHAVRVDPDLKVARRLQVRVSQLRDAED